MTGLLPPWDDGQHEPKGSLFDPTVEQMRESVRRVNEQCVRLQQRIGDASRALKRGAPALHVLAILDGATDE